MKTDEGWLPLPPLLERKAQTTKMSHGICDDCVDGLLQDGKP